MFNLSVKTLYNLALKSLKHIFSRYTVYVDFRSNANLCMVVKL
jgi:hypothetical protein